MDENLKCQFEELCAEFGMSAATAFNVFARAVVRERGIPFPIRASGEYGRLSPETAQALEDAALLRNLYGPYDTGKEAVAAMLED
jgi:addiction module RelB/DinJ family antitoxin